jgi:hypothetical protein
MSIEIVMRISGFLFLFILVINPFALAALGYIFGIGNYDSDAALKK